MSRFATLRRRPLGIARSPRRGGAMNIDATQESEFESDPRGKGPHSTLPYRQATELLKCIDIMGAESDAYCRHEVLGEELPPPEFETDAAISSPVPFGARLEASGNRVTSVGGIKVTLKPDTTTSDPKHTNGAFTQIKFNNVAISWSGNGKGGVSSITGPAAPTATIQTTYGPGAKASSSSGYGRGTTAADKAGGDTTLGFHEGRHGVDYLRYMASHPFPVFAGNTMMSADDVKAAAVAYRDAVKAYVAEVERLSVENTDCVGETDLASSEVKVVCDAIPAAATP
jgi:hypothetical protein